MFHISKITTAFILLAVIGVTHDTFANTSSYSKTKDSKIGFIAHTTMFDVDGTFQDWDSSINIDTKDLSKSSFEVQIATKSVNTGIDKRDAHLREDDFFNSPKFAYATFKSSKITVVSKNRLKIKGNLTIRNITRSIVFKAKYNWFEKANGRAIRIQGNTQVVRQNYDINYKASLLLPSVEDEVDITFDVTLIPPQTE